MVRPGRRNGALHAGRDPGDVRRVERVGAVDREPSLLAGAGPRERPRDDHLRRRVLGLALREAGRVRVAGRVEERVRLVDPVVDDPDLDPLAEPAGRGPELVGVDHAGALVGVEVVADARVDLAHGRNPLERRQLGVRQAHREPVEDDAVALLEPRARDRAADLCGGGGLGLGEPREVGARGGRGEAQLGVPVDRAEAAARRGRERRQVQADNHGDAAGRLLGWDPDHAVAQAWEHVLARARQADGPELGRGSGGREEDERR